MSNSDDYVRRCEISNQLTKEIRDAWQLVRCGVGDNEVRLIAERLFPLVVEYRIVNRRIEGVQAQTRDRASLKLVQ